MKHITFSYLPNDNKGNITNNEKNIIYIYLYIIDTLYGRGKKLKIANRIKI